MSNRLFFTILMLCILHTEAMGGVRIVPLPEKSETAPAIPDYRAYTPEIVRKKISLPAGEAKITVNRLENSRQFLRSIYSNNFLMFANKQNQLPQSIFVENGSISIKELSAQLPDNLVKTSSGDILVRLPIIVKPDAALIIESGDTVRLSAERGAFIHSNGVLVVDNATVEGWKESTNTLSSYTGDKSHFRPFIQSYGGSITYLISSTFNALGYESDGSYGMSLKSATPKLLDILGEHDRKKASIPPTGYIINSEFNDLYLGFYCYGAKDVVVVGNQYKDNITHGLDPHDYSSNLIIADNTVVGSQRHGIIISRHVNDSFIVDNVSYSNARTGIMIERLSSNNVVAFNESYDNRGDGITIYESPNNMVFGNRVYDNAEHGIRVRNSTDILIYNNIVLNNKGAGIYFHVRDLSYQTNRDLSIDPYTMSSSGEVVGGLIAYNSSGAIFSEQAMSLLLGKVRMESNGSAPLRGDLETHSAAIKVATWDHKNAAKVVFMEQQAEYNESN